MEVISKEIKDILPKDFKELINLLDEDYPADLLLMAVFLKLVEAVYKKISVTPLDRLDGPEINKIISKELKNLSVTLTTNMEMIIKNKH